MNKKESPSNKFKILIALLTIMTVSSNWTYSQEIDSITFNKTWSGDIDLLLNKIFTVHPNPFRKYSKIDWQNKAKLLKKNEPSNNAEAALSIKEFLAMAADGHTKMVYTPKELRGHWLPLHIRHYEEGWFVRTGDPQYKELFGKPITHIESISIDTVTDILNRYVSSDNSSGALDHIGDLMRNALILETLDIGTRNSVELTVRNYDGTEESHRIIPTNDSWVTDQWRDVDRVLNPGVKPLYRDFDDAYDFKYYEEKQTMYVWFSKVRDEGNETIEQFFERVFDFVKNNPVKRFVLDIRENTGGNNYLNSPVLHGLIKSQKVNYPGGLFVIIGDDTFSAAMCLAVELEKHTYALFVGSPTAATPNHFGDTEEFKLPYTQFTVEVSELYWQNSDPRDNRPWITPDIPVSLSFAEFLNHQDPLLDAIFEFQTSDTLTANFGPPNQRWQRANQLNK